MSKFIPVKRHTYSKTKNTTTKNKSGRNIKAESKRRRTLCLDAWSLTGTFEHSVSRRGQRSISIKHDESTLLIFYVLCEFLQVAARCNLARQHQDKYHQQFQAIIFKLSMEGFGKNWKRETCKVQITTSISKKNTTKLWTFDIGGSYIKKLRCRTTKLLTTTHGSI